MHLGEKLLHIISGGKFYLNGTLNFPILVKLPGYRPNLPHYLPKYPLNYA